MKRMIALCLAVLLILAVVVACKKAPQNEEGTTSHTTETTAEITTASQKEEVPPEEEKIDYSQYKYPAEVVQTLAKGTKTLTVSDGCKEAVISGVTLEKAIAAFETEKYTKMAVDQVENAKFETVVLTRQNYVITIHWIKTKMELRILWEEKKTADITPLTKNVNSGQGKLEIVQIGVERVNENDNPMIGMCYVVKLSNGHALILDGGFENERCPENIYKTLEKMNIAKEDGRFVIDAWIFSHGHADHIGAFRGFAPKYTDNVTVKYFMYNFMRDNVLGSLECDPASLAQLIKQEFPEAKKINPHAGLKYYFDNAVIHMLYTPELMYAYGKQVAYFNDTSLIFQVENGGKKAMFVGDSAEKACETLLPLYDKAAFRSDIVQITHHGLYTVPGGHEWDALKQFYEATQAKYALLPMHSHYNKGGRNGRHTVMISWCNSGYQISFVMNENDKQGMSSISDAFFTEFEKSALAGNKTINTLYGYDGINKIVNEKGMITYTGSNTNEPMITLFSLSSAAVNVTVNQTLYSWFAS